MARITDKLREKVLSTLDKRVEMGELTIEARDRIVAYVENDWDHDHAHELEADIEKDIDAAPTHEALASWKDERQSLWEQIKAIKAEERFFNNEIKDLEQQKRNIAQEMASNINNISHEQRDAFLSQLDTIDNDIEKNVETLRELTYEKSALGIMHAEAKSQEAQMVGQKWKETYQPVLDAVQRGWNDARIYVRDSIEHLNNRRDLMKDAKSMEMGFIESHQHKFHLNRARKELISMNKAEQALRDAEQKLIAAAQPLKRDVAKAAILERFGRGVQLEKPETIEQAQAVLEARGNKGVFHSDQKALADYKKAVEDLTKIRDKHEAAAKEHLTKVRDTLDQRRENAFRTMHEVEKKFENGELGRDEHAADKIMEELGVVLDDSFIPAEMLDENVLQYLMDQKDEFGSILIENFDADAYAKAIDEQIEIEELAMNNAEINEDFPFQVVEGEQLSFFDDVERDEEEIEEIDNNGPVIGE